MCAGLGQRKPKDCRNISIQHPTVKYSLKNVVSCLYSYILQAPTYK